jgi:hypothetical protein
VSRRRATRPVGQHNHGCATCVRTTAVAHVCSHICSEPAFELQLSARRRMRSAFRYAFRAVCSRPSCGRHAPVSRVGPPAVSQVGGSLSTLAALGLATLFAGHAESRADTKPPARRQLLAFGGGTPHHSEVSKVEPPSKSEHLSIGRSRGSCWLLAACLATTRSARFADTTRHPSTPAGTCGRGVTRQGRQNRNLR